jgi:hypothetical protein
MNYIADFYCAKARLVIELDGSQHYTEDGMSHDAARTEALNTLGLEVLRFSNLDIDENLSGVCEEINLAVLSRIVPYGLMKQIKNKKSSVRKVLRRGTRRREQAGAITKFNWVAGAARIGQNTKTYFTDIMSISLF